MQISSYALSPISPIIKVTDQTSKNIHIPQTKKGSSSEVGEHTPHTHGDAFEELNLDIQTLITLQDIHEKFLRQIGQNYYSHISNS